MSQYEIKAYECEWCGRIFKNKSMTHDIECLYDPKARSCVSCSRNAELIREYNSKHGIVYCPRAQRVFKYPEQKYCSEYVQSEGFISLDPNKKEA